jgi:NAD(P)H-hydrate epimerase
MNLPAVAWDQAAVVPSADLRRADRLALDRFGIAPGQLMEIAGWQIARLSEALLDGAREKRVLVVAGSGNNGGDALCAARFLLQRGASISAAVVTPKDPQGLAARHATTLGALGVDIKTAPDGIDGGADLIIDGLLGTGIRLPLRQPLPQIIEAIGKARAPVIGVDVPSGMEADDGSGADQAIRCAATLTLAAPKAGLPLSDVAGRIFLADIGMPVALFGAAAARLEAIYRIADLIELRRPEQRLNETAVDERAASD